MIKEFISKTVRHWVVLLRDRSFRISLLVGLSILIASYLVNIKASVYNDTQSYVSVSDLIIDHVPVVNLHLIFSWGMYFVLLTLFVYPVFFKPEICPFAMKTFALLIFLRSGFILLTNVGPPIGFFYEGLKVGGSVFTDIAFRNDLFFSGHTAYPFLAYLIFKETKFRWFLLFSSILMAVTVILMHIHYSIDVFAAFFITYGTYVMSDRIFNRLNLRFVEILKKLKV